jgi:hypothetical protein
MSAVVIAIAALPTVSLLLMGLARMESLLTVGLDEPVVAGSTVAGSAVAGSALAEAVAAPPVADIEDVGALAA